MQHFQGASRTGERFTMWPTATTTPAPTAAATKAAASSEVQVKLARQSSSYHFGPK